jgi:hypothetical protein
LVSVDKGLTFDAAIEFQCMNFRIILILLLRGLHSEYPSSGYFLPVR